MILSEYVHNAAALIWIQYDDEEENAWLKAYPIVKGDWNGGFAYTGLAEKDPYECALMFKNQKAFYQYNAMRYEDALNIANEALSHLNAYTVDDIDNLISYTYYKYDNKFIGFSVYDATVDGGHAISVTGDHFKKHSLSEIKVYRPDKNKHRVVSGCRHMIRGVPTIIPARFINYNYPKEEESNGK